MPLKWFQCQVCAEQFRTKNTEPLHCEQPAEELITIPSVKMMEKKNPESGKSTLVDQQKILLKRSREHSRDNSMHDLVQMNEDHLAKQNRWVTDSGGVRKKIDDL